MKLRNFGGKMLEFIVLGKIPGTHFEITFRGLLLVLGLSLLVGESSRMLLHHWHQRHSSVNLSQTVS